jgi:hypothetical protein
MGADMSTSHFIERRTQHRLRGIITDLQTEHDRRQVQWEKQALAVALLQNDVAWLRQEVAKHRRRFK